MSNLRLLSAALFVLAFAISVPAQALTADDIDSEAIFIQGTGSGLLLSYRDQMTGIDFGIMNKAIEDRLLRYADSRESYQAYQDSTEKQFIWFTGYLASITCFALAVSDSLDKRPHMNRPLGIGISVGALFGSVGFLRLLIEEKGRGRARILGAVTLYNGHLL